MSATCSTIFRASTDTTAILIYLETITNPRKFLSAARVAARAMPVLVIKAGRNAAAAKAAATHTGALSGNDQVVGAAFKRAGLLRVDDLEELFDAAETLTRLGRIKGDRLAIVTNGGGAGVLAVERLMQLGGTLAELAPETMESLDRALPPTWSKGNPVDVIGDAGPERYAAAVERRAERSGHRRGSGDELPDGARILRRCGPGGHPGDRPAQRRPPGPKPVLTNWLGESTARIARGMFAAAGIPTYEFPADAVQSFSYLTAYNKAQQELMRTPPSLPDNFEVDAEAARKAMADAQSAGRDMLTEPEAKAVLAAYGIATAETHIAKDAREVEQIAPRLLAKSGQVVVKLLSEDISHKSDVGGVVLNLESAAAAAKAAEEIAARVARVQPGARIQGFTVQEMVRRSGAHELIAGVSEDPIFGPTILFGAGGTAVEVTKDTAVALPPLDLNLAHNLIAETRVSKLLRGYRDRPAAELDAIAMALVRISQLITDLPMITELDINPLLADERGVIALDARVKVGLGQGPGSCAEPVFCHPALSKGLGENRGAIGWPHGSPPADPAER